MAPLNWILLCFTYLLIGITLGLIPLLGSFIGILTVPVFVAGIMVGCRKLDLSGKLELEYLFYGFKIHGTSHHNRWSLSDRRYSDYRYFHAAWGDAVVDMWLHGKRFSENELPGVMDDLLFASLLCLLLAIPLMMSIWFAPMLVVFENMPPLIAIRKSFFACLKNLFAFQIYMAILFVLGMLAAMLYGLGFIIWFPVAFASVYVSYKDIFHYEQDEDTQPKSDEPSTEENKEDSSQTNEH